MAVSATGWSVMRVFVACAKRLITRILPIIAGAFVASTPSECVAQLHWDTKRIEISATAGDRDVRAIFRAQNTSPAPIKILDIQTSCDCTAAAASRYLVPPGETTEIEAVFTLEDRVGRQQKIIQITTDDAATSPIQLDLRVQIAEVVVGNPKVVMWALGAEPAEKTVQLTGIGSHQLRNIRLEEEVHGFTCEIHSDPISGFQLRVKPLSTQRSTQAVIRCRATVDDRPELSVSVYAIVK
jgi:hypothetical protein